MSGNRSPHLVHHLHHHHHLYLHLLLLLLNLIAPTHSTCSLKHPALSVEISPTGSTKLKASKIILEMSTVVTSSSLTLTKTTVITTNISCQIVRNYTSNVSTSELFTTADDAGGLAWTFGILHADIVQRPSQRLPVEIVTVFNVNDWQKNNMEWWMPLTSPSDALGGRSSPFGPTSSVTNGSQNVGFTYNYGGTKFDLNGTDGLPKFNDNNKVFNNYSMSNSNGYVLPLLSLLQKKDVGFSFFETQDTQTTYADIYIHQINNDTARFKWTRRLLGISTQMTETKLLHGQLFAHENCWRPALGKYWEHDAAAALPNSHVQLSDTEGAATYAYFFNQPGFQPASYYSSMDLTMNWDASFPWLYHGPWVPYENSREYFPTPNKSEMIGSDDDDEFTWLNCDPAGHGGHAIRTTTPDWPTCMNQNYSLLNSWYNQLKSKYHVSTLMYGTLEEFGIEIDVERGVIGTDVPACTTMRHNYTNRLICGANRLFSDSFPLSYLVNPRTNQSISAAWNSVIVDFGRGSGYDLLLLNNTKRIVKQFSASVAGVCLDRGDYIGLMNVNADDGITTTPDGRNARALVQSWRNVTASIGDLLHQAGMSLYANPDMGHRVDMYRNIDGFYSELGDTKPGNWRMGTAWLASGGKHAAIWCHAKGDPETNCASFMTNGTTKDRDYYLQSHLLIGVYPTVPFPDNDHEILPHLRADIIYQEYGDLFQSMHGKRWYTGAHPMTLDVADGEVASANIFEMKPFGSGCYRIPIVWSNASSVNVELGQNIWSSSVRNSSSSSSTNSTLSQRNCQVMHLNGAVKECKVNSDGVIRNVAIVRGCAVVLLCV